MQPNTLSHVAVFAITESIWLRQPADVVHGFITKFGDAGKFRCAHAV
jgi:hypothetical protein